MLNSVKGAASSLPVASGDGRSGGKSPNGFRGLSSIEGKADVVETLFEAFIRKLPERRTVEALDVVPLVEDVKVMLRLACVVVSGSWSYVLKISESNWSASSAVVGAVLSQGTGKKGISMLWRTS